MCSGEWEEENVWKLTLLHSHSSLGPCLSPIAPPPRQELTTGVSDLSWAESMTFSDPEHGLEVQSGSFGHISWGQVIVWVVRQPCTEKQIELVHRRQREKREGRRSRDKEPRVPERRCMRGQLPWTKGILVSPKAPNLVILRFHEITFILGANSLSYLHYLIYVWLPLTLEQRGG